MEKISAFAVLALSVISVACDGPTTPVDPYRGTPPVEVNYTVSGTVTEVIAGEPMPVEGMRVSVSGTILSAVTDRNGFYSIAGIRTAQGSISATKDGYVTFTLLLTSTADTRLDIRVAPFGSYSLSGMAYEMTPAGRVPIAVEEPTLLDLAQRAPQTLDDLTGIVAMTPGQIHRHGSALLRAVQDGLGATPPSLPVVERLPDDVLNRYDRLQQWRKTRAQARGVESDVILPRTTLWDLARRPPRTLADLADIVDFGPTRRAMYGQEIIAVIGAR